MATGSKWLHVLLLIVSFTLCLEFAYGSVGGSISGLVTDPSGAVIAGAEVVALDTATGIKQTVQTDAAGFYSFPALLIGPYEIDVRQVGFKEFRATGLVIDANTALRVDAKLEVGTVTQEVSVNATALQVDTVSTQVGEVIGSTAMEIVPLNGRSFVDLMALQPGVVPKQSGMYSGTVSGELDAGNYSVSGAREDANGFMLNGGNVEAGQTLGILVSPNLDSIAEFRILTNNADAEYGNFAGGMVNAITKSGTNQFHGDAFDFIRNSDLDSRNFYSGSRGTLHKNEFGGTIGGPIRRDRVFFFADYQGNRQVIGASSGAISVPSPQDLTGNLSDQASQLTGSVVGSAFASQLSTKLGYAVTNGEPYYTPGCTSATCVFPGAVIPQSAWASPAAPLIKYIPTPIPSLGYFETSAYDGTLRDDKWSSRIDANTRLGLLSGYYFFDQDYVGNPYAGAPVPGFSGNNAGRVQNVNLGLTKSFGPTAVNEFRLNYTRSATSSYPVGGVGPSLSSLGFVAGGLGIVPDGPIGVPDIYFNNFSIGTTGDNLTYNNTYQVLDNFSKVVRTHSFKFGGSVHFDQVENKTFDENMGQFTFNGSETGLDIADFLIGAPTSYDQGVQLPFHTRSKYYGLYLQDSWRARKDLTVNYGLRWESSSPFYEIFNEMNALKLGENSQVFPGSPTGWVFPGDPGIPTTIANTRWNNFAPRIGVAYAPHANGGFLGKVLGDAGQTSVRAAWGVYYTAYEENEMSNASGDAPFGYYYSSVAPPQFATPFVDRATGIVEGQKFPAPVPPVRPVPSPAHPYTIANWASFFPISSSPVLGLNDSLPYAEDYDVSVQRQFGSDTMLTVSYVGTQGHRLLSAVQSNPGNPALCLSVSQASQVVAGGATCLPNGENTVYTTAAGATINGTRAPFGIDFGSNDYFNTMGNSNYNSLQVSLRHTSRRSTFLAAYTFSKVLADASSWGSGGDNINPINPKISKALASFDVPQNFVVSYNYEIPFEKLWRPNRLTTGWVIAGITHFSTGLPVLLQEADDNSLLGTLSGGPGSNGVDEPNRLPGSLNFSNPRLEDLSTHTNPEFNNALFTKEAIGQLGDSNRRFFHGSGLNNWDLTLEKNVRLTESKRFEFRVEFFDLFNHAEFNNPSGNVRSSNFGFVTSAGNARIGEVAGKFYF